MKIKELIRQLKEVEKINPNASIFMDFTTNDENNKVNNSLSMDFTGFSVDDNNDVLLYVSGDDEEA